MLVALVDLPRPCAESYCDFMLLYRGASRRHLLVYEKHRDFLSAPRSFVVLTLHCDAAALMLAADTQYPDVEYDEQGEMLEVGFFRVTDSEYAGDDQQHLLLSFPGERIEALAEDLEMTADVVAVSAQAALLQYMASE
ncbi:hypothetical protein [Bacterioplanoides pacificum]|uniref:Uncharacterized protein n=1 Tax=Bacterioplanoides pacificum TaxID=1171596 RepID=A0ABV7VN30_9GAMM